MSLRYPLRSGLSRLVHISLPVIAIVAGMGLLAGMSGCDDDRPTMPANTDAWHVEDLPLLTIGVGLTAIDFDGNQGHILGGTSQKVGTDYLLLSRDPERHWVSAQLADPPDNAVLLDLAAGALGLAVGEYAGEGSEPAPDDSCGFTGSTATGAAVAAKPQPPAAAAPPGWLSHLRERLKLW